MGRVPYKRSVMVGKVLMLGVWLEVRRVIFGFKGVISKALSKKDRGFFFLTNEFPLHQACKSDFMMSIALR